MEERIVPKLAFESLREAEDAYKEAGTFSQSVLENLYSFFGESFVLATELLEKCRIIEYSTEEELRSIFKIVTSKDQYTIYPDINFCHCKTFHLQVLELGNLLTCRHVLAVKLGQITNQVTREKVRGNQLVDFLNEQLCYVEENS